MHIKSSKMIESKNLHYIRKHVKYGPYYIDHWSYRTLGKPKRKKKNCFKKSLNLIQGSREENDRPGTEADAGR